MLLAYLAYVKSINDKYESWKTLLLSFRADLNAQESWLATGYSSYNNKDSYSTYKVILPLSFESLKEIIKRGANDNDLRFTEEFIKKISIFNERVEGFNKLLDQQRLVVTSDPVMLFKLDKKLTDFGLYNRDISDDLFIKSVENNLKSDQDLYALARNIWVINEHIHVRLISNKDNENGLFSLRIFILNEIENKINKLEFIKPWYIQKSDIIWIFSLIIFLLIEVFLK